MLPAVYPLLAEVYTCGPNEAQSLLEFDLSQKADFSSADSLIWLETLSAGACLHLQKYLFKTLRKIKKPGPWLGMSVAGAGKLGTTWLRGTMFIKASFVLLISNHFQGVKDPCSHFLHRRTNEQKCNSFQHRLKVVQMSSCKEDKASQEMCSGYWVCTGQGEKRTSAILEGGPCSLHRLPETAGLG